MVSIKKTGQEQITYSFGRFTSMLLSSPLFLLIIWSSLWGTSTATNNSSSYFASINHDAYLDWLSDRSDYYAKSAFLPSPETPTDGVAIHWKVTGEEIIVAVAARATGWLGFGISENGGMKGADLVYYTAENDQLIDAHVLDDISSGPLTDVCQDWSLLNSQVYGGFVIFEATRSLATGDTQDRDFVPDDQVNVPATRIIAAWGDSPEISYHGPNSRVRGSVRLFGGEGEPNESDSFRAAMDTEAEGFIEVRAKEYPVKPIDTEYAYFCVFLSDLAEQGMPNDVDLHIVGIEPIVSTDSERFVHHFTVYGSEEDLRQNDCDEASFLDMAYVWTPGEGPIILPDNVGIPLGVDNFVSFRLETHYNNPTLVRGANDSSGVRFYYSSNKRQYDMGVLQLGDPFVQLEGEPVALDGESTSLFRHDFNCPSTCSADALTGDQQLTVFREFLHMHQTGSRMSNRQIRNGETIRTGAVDFFDFNQNGNVGVQQEPFVIQSGDSFETSCYYDVDRQQDSNIQFGLSSQDEMCIAFLFYFPRVRVFNNQYPYVCGYDLAPGCDASWNAVALQDNADLERSFGVAPDSDNVCQATVEQSITPSAQDTPSPTVEQSITPSAQVTPNPTVVASTSKPTGTPTYTSPTTSKPTGLNFKFGECEGDCNDDNDCEGDLICFQVNMAIEEVPGCAAALSRSFQSVCYDPSNKGEGSTPSATPTMSISASPSSDSTRAYSFNTISSGLLSFIVILAAWIFGS